MRAINKFKVSFFLRKASFLFNTHQTTKCSESDEQTIANYSEDHFESITTTRGSKPGTDETPWANQVFQPEPIKFTLSPIINLFTDNGMRRQNIITGNKQIH